MPHGRLIGLALAGLFALGMTAPIPNAALASPETVRWPVATLPLGRFVSFFVRPPHERAARVGESALTRAEGWRSLRFAVGDHGLGVYLAVTGEAQFDLAYIDYDDGTQDRIELGVTHRKDGLFALAEYAADRPVTRVSLIARAVSPEARISVLRGR